MPIDMLDAVYDFQGHYNGANQSVESQEKFHGVIYPIDPRDTWNLAKKAVIHHNSSTLEEKTNGSFQKTLKPMDAGGKIGGGVEITWGDGNRIDFSGYIEAEAHDNRGNYGEIKIEQKNDGTGSVNISAGHKEGDERDK